jgi:hypothetical protein
MTGRKRPFWQAALFGAAWVASTPVWADPTAPASARAQGVSAEASHDFRQALLAFETCAAEGDDRDRRYCEARLQVLRPQAIDDFAGWRILSEVRADYGQIGTAEARLRVSAALDANPEGPAAPALSRWLTHLDLREGKVVDLAHVASEDAPWIAERLSGQAQIKRHQQIGWVGGALAAVYFLVGQRGKAPLATRGAAVAALFIGLIPTLLAAGWDKEFFLPFLRNTFIVWVCALLAPRVNPAVAVVGTLGGLLANASASGWLVSLGFP